MRVRVGREDGVSKQRGFWLRCFLGASLGTASLMILTTGAPVRAQISVNPPYHMARLRGVFVDAKGNPIAGAAVTLDQNDQAKYSASTDGTGRFDIKHISGRFWLHLHAKGYAPVGRQVVIGLEAEPYLHGSTLYIIAGPGGCSDDCSTVFTSKGKFERAIRDYTARYEEESTR